MLSQREINRVITGKIKRWKIYYADGSTFSSDDGHITDAPVEGVQAIGYQEGLTHKVVAGKDYYYFFQGRWHTLDLNKLVNFLKKEGLLKEGSLIEDDEFNEIYQKARDDPFFDLKQYFRPQDMV